MFNRKIRMGMVGGGPGAFIGEVHRKASRIDGFIELVAGAFDINPEKSIEMGQKLFLSPDRVYCDYKKMIESELKLSKDKRIDFVSIVTPNNWHYPIAKDFLEAGFHVLCEKPMTMTLDEAKELEQIVKDTDNIFCLMHNYTGYPMVKLARDMVRQGDLGKILKVVVQYKQGWLLRPIKREGQKWRKDPKQAGIAGCIGDIGSHSENLVEYISNLKITEVCADLSSINNNDLDDDGNCLLHFDNGAKGILQSSQISAGEENNLAIWVYGEKKSLEWHQEDPNNLIVNGINKPQEIWKRGNDYVADKSSVAALNSRIPPGHPEAFLEAFANNYMNFAKTINAKLEGHNLTETEFNFPTVKDGVRGMQFIEKVVESAKSNQKWIKI